LEVSEDVWLASDLGFFLDKQEPRSKLVFLYIQQDWLKDIAKKFVRFMAATRRARTVRGYISTFNNFSQYLSENHLEVDIRQINRSVIIGFIEYMAQKGWGAQHRTA